MWFLKKFAHAEVFPKLQFLGKLPIQPAAKKGRPHPEQPLFFS
jgi:hypothetical protein